MTWHGQINRTIWELEHRLKEHPHDAKLRRELLRTHFLQRYEYDRSLHVPRDDRTFLFLQEQRSSAVLLLHGGKGTPAEVRDLGNYLYARGFTVYAPRLSRVDLKNRQASWQSWVTDAENVLTTMQQYTNRIVLGGLSMGGTVALMLQRMHKVNGLVLMAPAIHLKLNFARRLQSLARHITPTLFFRFAGWDGEIVRCIETVRKSQEKIEIPVLAIQAQDDHLVSMKGMKSVKKWATNEKNEFVVLPEGSHVVTRGSARETVFKHVFDFAQSCQPQRRRFSHRSGS